MAAEKGRSVAVVVRNDALRARVTSVLGPRWSLVQQVRDVVDIARAVAEGALHAVVVEADGASRLRGIVSARKALHATPVVAVVDQLTHGVLRAVLDGTMDGAVLASDVENALEPALEAAAAGQLTIPRVSRRFAKPVLSRREKQVLGMVVMGCSNADIARQLFVTQNTVKSHLSSAFAKLGVASRNEAAALILDRDAGLGLGILSLSDGLETDDASARDVTRTA